MHFLIKDKAVSPVFYAIARNLGPIVNIKTCRGYIQFSHFDGNGFNICPLGHSSNGDRRKRGMWEILCCALFYLISIHIWLNSIETIIIFNIEASRLKVVVFHWTSAEKINPIFNSPPIREQYFRNKTFLFVKIEI